MREQLEQRKKKLLMIKAEKEKALINAPKGSIRVSCCRGKTKYLLQPDNEKEKERSLRKEEAEQLRQLLQRDYDERVLKSVNQELRAINRYVALYPTICAEQVFGCLHEARQRLIEPICETDETYIKSWEGISYRGKEIVDTSNCFQTQKGEWVRSKSELILANLLYEEGIPYRYEYPLAIPGERKIYPDFCVLNVRTRQEYRWEHFGMMDHPPYAEATIKKIALYEKNGFMIGKNLIATFETKQAPIDIRQIKQKIETYLK